VIVIYQKLATNYPRLPTDPEQLIFFFLIGRKLHRKGKTPKEHSRMPESNPKSQGPHSQTPKGRLEEPNTTEREKKQKNNN
jgi:hypothetical protein